MATVYKADPLKDPRWERFLQRHPRASVFHTTPWLETLRRTYGYEPTVLTTSAPGSDLTNGLVFCHVRSWLTGRRLVSLPFSDHCEPLVDDVAAYRELIQWLRTDCELQGCKFVELRPLSTIQDLENIIQPSQSYCLHMLDMRPSLEQIFRGLHKDSIQRRIRRAEREGLSYESGRSYRLVDEFFQLLLMTRRRHQLPPQPRIWFRNMVDCMGNNINIRLARKNSTPIAAMLSLCHRSSVVYKYGCSDDNFHNLGAMPFLFWKLIEESKASGAEQLDFGRSDLSNNGLLTFKDRFGAKRTVFKYYRYPSTDKVRITTEAGQPALRHLFSLLPDSVLATAGSVLYRHIG